MTTVWDRIFRDGLDGKASIGTHDVSSAMALYADGTIVDQAEFGALAIDRQRQPWSAAEKLAFKVLLDNIDNVSPPGGELWKPKDYQEAKNDLAARYGHVMELVNAHWITPAQAKTRLGI